MITPADDFDDGPDLDPDDPLTVILRPASGHLGPPPGRYEEIRRGAVRRRLLRTAAGVGATCGIAALAVLLPLRLTASEAPARPAVPLAPPPVSGPSTLPVPSPSTPQATEDPTEGADTPAPGPRASTAPAATAVPTIGRDLSRSPEATTASGRGASSTAPIPSFMPSATDASR